MNERFNQVQKLHARERLAPVIISSDDELHEVTELRDVRRRSNECLALVAHEMRNSLAAIAYAAEMLHRIGDDRALKVQGIIKHQTRVLDRMVQDLLSSGTIKLLIEPVDLKTVVKHAVETTHSLIENLDHELIVSLDPRLPLIRADAIRLEQVLVNLLSNAAKFTESGGHIRLIAWCEESEVVIRVVDDGIGISPDVLPQVFDLFFQATSGNSSGLGVGLALVRSLVKMHRGTISVVSEGIGRGSEFTVRLPASCE